MFCGTLVLKDITSFYEKGEKFYMLISIWKLLSQSRMAFFTAGLLRGFNMLLCRVEPLLTFKHSYSHLL